MPSALKAFHHQRNYLDKLESYQRLRAADIHELSGFAVPKLIGFEDELQVIEMSIVQPPYLLDFGKVYFDRPPTDIYDSRQLKEAENYAKQLFGNQWPDVAGLLYTLRERFGIWYVDPKPANISFGDMNEDDWEAEPGLDYGEYEED